jgi:type I restriction enzyme S subunit
VQTRSYWNWVKVNSMRSGQPGINGREYASLPLPLPPTLPEQTAIASVLSDMDSALSAIETKLTKARQLKQGMMQNLLTGRIRLV